MYQIFLYSDNIIQRGAKELAKRAVFEVAYEGPAVDEGVMDVRELAPALLALGDLVERTNKIIGDPEIQVKVFVRASFEKGSFQISLELIYSITEQIRMFLQMQNTSDLAEKILLALGFASGGGLSLIKLIKYIRGRKIKNATVLDNGNVRLELPGDNGKFDYVEVDGDVIRLYRDVPVRESVYRLMSPLEKEGITGFSVREGKNVIERVSKEEVPYYKVPDEVDGEKSITFTRKAFVKPVEVAFEEGLKWRFSDGDNKFYATMDDESFLKEMDAGKPFSKGDILEVELETTQTATSKGIKNEHRVVKVINHITPPKQIRLPFDDDEQ